MPSVNFYDTDPSERGEIRLRAKRRGETAVADAAARKPQPDRSRRAEIAVEQYASRAGLPLTENQQKVLAVLDAPRRACEVKDLTGISASSTTAALVALDAKGLVCRSKTLWTRVENT